MSQFEGLQGRRDADRAREPLGDLDDGRIATRILLGERHLWGKRRVAIPISAVADFSDGVRLRLARDEVRDLPTAGPAPGGESPARPRTGAQ
ncbi:MAG: hypothetical protein ACR2MP_15640 [Streptosporangiaceae bacterium]